MMMYNPSHGVKRGDAHERAIKAAAKQHLKDREHEVNLCDKAIARLSIMLATKPCREHRLRVVQAGSGLSNSGKSLEAQLAASSTMQTLLEMEAVGVKQDTEEKKEEEEEEWPEDWKIHMMHVMWMQLYLNGRWRAHWKSLVRVPLGLGFMCVHWPYLTYSRDGI